MKQAFDLSHIPTRHDAINLRLESWARWVRVSPKAWAMQPMWRNAKTPRQWDLNPVIHETLNTIECSETERAVSFLPEKNRTAIRWAYVRPWIHQGKIQRELGVTADALSVLIVDARDMLAIRLKMRMKDDDR